MTDTESTPLTFVKGVVIILIAMALSSALYMVYLLITTISNDTAVHPMNDTFSRKKITARTFSSISTPEFYKLQGLSMNDVIRTRLVEYKTADKIHESGNAEAALNNVVRLGQHTATVDTDNNIYIDYDTTNAKRDSSILMRGTIDS